MIKIDFLVTRSGELVGFEISGHANYANHGKDIICVAVSSTAYMTINSISEILKIDAEIRINEKHGYMYLSVPFRDSKVCELILKSFKTHMLLMEESYPDNIEVNYVEVE